MAFRIYDSVLRGEINNRVKGIVHGKIWLVGRTEPVVLELQGNAWPDLAGCLLTFANPLKPVPHRDLDSLQSLQRGRIGDLTASRKVRVFDIPTEEAYMMCKQGRKPPEHMANSLYLEWFSEANGRVVIESANYEVTISAPEWRLTPAENETRARQAAAGMEDFMQRLTAAVEAQRHEIPDDPDDWDEFEWEKTLRESDAGTNKYAESLDKYGYDPNADEIIDKAWAGTKGPASGVSRKSRAAARKSCLPKNGMRSMLRPRKRPMNRSCPTHSPRAWTGFAPPPAISAIRCNTAVARAPWPCGTPVRSTVWIWTMIRTCAISSPSSRSLAPNWRVR